MTLLRARPDGGGVIAGWSASVELAPETMLAASASAPRSAGGEVISSARSLVVLDATATLAGTTLGFTEWFRRVQDSGERRGCPGGSGGCGGLVGFGLDIVTRHLSRLEGDSAVPPIAVAWEVSVAADGASTLLEPTDAPVLSEPKIQQLGIPVQFPDVAGEHCVRVTTRDLRTGANVVSDPVCGTPPASISESSADSIQLCPSAPPGYEERWCRARGSSGTSCSSGGAGGIGGLGGAAPMVGGAGFGGAFISTSGAGGSVGGRPAGGGEAGENTVAGSTGSGAAGAATGGTDSVGGNAGTPDNEPESPAGRRIRTEGCGCSAPRTGSNALGILGMLMAFALWARRPRRARGPER
jgi:MYXO-CTERM domain-containing protein